MKTFLIIIGLIVVLGIVYFAFIRTPSTATTENSTNTSDTAKLDINVICEGALSYMTFPDGASAEKFVAECKAGEHPEVIDRYKQDMNLGEGAAI
jgi:hypothetical protein